MTPPPSTPHALEDTTREAAPTDGGRKPLGAFLRRPALPSRATGIGVEGLVGVARLYAVDCAAMSVLGLIALGVLTTGFEFPTNVLNEVELTPGFVAIVVLGAPLTEELVFRSWLSGRPGHLVAGLASAAAILLLPAAFATSSTGVAGGMAVAVALGLAAGLVALWRWRERGPLRWFARGFPVIFWLVTLVFALVHLVNYEEGALYVLLPLVLPQFIAGTLFGYARVQYGLWAAMLLHALHNGTAVAIVLLASEAIPGAS